MLLLADERLHLAPLGSALLDELCGLGLLALQDGSAGGDLALGLSHLREDVGLRV